MKQESHTFSDPIQNPQGTGRGDRSGHRRRRRKRKKGPNGHTVFFLICALILAVTLIRLFVWNIGKKSGFDPNATSTEFDVELLDYVQPLDPAVLEGREDDGVTTVLALGNDILADERGKDGLAALMEKETKATLLNGAFPGSTIAMKNADYQNSYPLDGLSLYWVAAALCNQNFELMERVTADLDSDSAAAALETLKGVDMERVDALVILYDLQDYMGRRTVYDEQNLMNLNTVYGALNATIRLFQENFPHIRIYMMSQPYGTFTEGSVTYDADRDDLSNGTLTDYINWELEVSRTNGITFIDAYYGAVTMEDSDCLTDGFHLNKKGRQKMAKRFADVFAPSSGA